MLRAKSDQASLASLGPCGPYSNRATSRLYELPALKRKRPAVVPAPSLHPVVALVATAARLVRRE